MLRIIDSGRRVLKVKAHIYCLRAVFLRFFLKPEQVRVDEKESEVKATICLVAINHLSLPSSKLLPVSLLGYINAQGYHLYYLYDL